MGSTPTPVSSISYSISETSVTVTPATELGNPGAHVGSSATQGSSSSTTASEKAVTTASNTANSSYGVAASSPGPTGFDSNGGILTSSGSTYASGDSGSDTTTLILSISIPIGILVIIIMLLSGIIIGRRMARRDASSWNEPSAKVWWRFWRGGGGHIQLDDQEGLDVRRERCELPGEDIVRELPTDVNIQEMEERRELVELPVPTPPGSLRSVRRGGSRGT